MSKENIAHLLEEHGVKATANRIIVLEALMDAERPLSMHELEEVITSLDKSSIFRSLVAMKDADLLHCLDAGPEGVRYEVCHGHHHDGAEDDDDHVHFYCEQCGKTFCLHEMPIPKMSMPSGYESHHREFTIKGLCPSCAGK